ncbi:MAG TPA: transporter [Kiritimatiellia bacterium]|nr:transporter [Kiritimatiellia bacterium]
MLTRALMTATVSLAMTGSLFAQPAQTRIHGSDDTRSIYQNVNNGPMRTLLTRENRYPNVGQLEIGAFYGHAEYLDDFEQDSYGVYGRYGLSEFVTVEASIPVVDSNFGGKSEFGLGDVELKLDLLAFQDIFNYPFIIPHIDVSLPTGDEDKGLGSGDTIIVFGISIGTKVYEKLTYVIDASYAFNGGNSSAKNDNVFMISGSIVWDISDRFAVLVEGRVWEKNDFDSHPYQYQGGLAYKITRDVQIAGYGGTYREDTLLENKFDLAGLRLSIQF